MAIETTATVINDLNPEYPIPGDYISEGDDHIKLIKQVVKNTFPTANTPLTPDFTYFNKMPDYVDFTTRNVGGAEVKIVEVQDARITGGLAGVEDTDVTILKQVKDLITTALKNIFPVGCYWNTDSNSNPADVFGFGSWQKVTGVLMGSGIVHPDGSVPNQSARTFVVGEKGGSFSKGIKEENIPLLTSDFSTNGIRTAGAGGHDHVVKYRLQRLSIDDINSLVVDPSDGNNNTEKRTQRVDDHVHNLSGILRLGRPLESQVPIDVMNPYIVTNIWKRTS